MTGEWHEWSNHVLADLKRLEQSSNQISIQLQKIEIEIATLKVKSGIFGAVGASIPVVAMILYDLIIKK